MRRSLRQQTARYTLLTDRQRREVYLYVRRARGAIGKDAVATGLGITRALATFHLERLLEGGFVHATFERANASRAGRPSKYYYAGDEEIMLTIPDRRYDVVAEILSRAVVETGGGGSAVQRAMEVARDRGTAIGQSFAKDNGIRPSRGASLAQTELLVDEMGYEPRRDGGQLLLENCPFAAVVEPPFLICGLNKQLLDGALDGCGAKLTAEAEHRAGCCVVLRPAPRLR